MDSKDMLKFRGKIVDVKRDLFQVELENGMKVLAYLSGSMRKNYIKVGIGDMVEVEISPYDLTRGRIIWRIDREGVGK